jgi:undecaprenyl-diphosphatase
VTLPPVIRAALAGSLHGVVEWLPVSSSGHVALLIDAAGWPEADPSRRTERRAIEVALHTGSLLPLGRRVSADLRVAAAPKTLAGAAVAATGLTSVVGGLAGPAVERRFAGPRSVAFGLVAGSIGLIAAERRAARLAGSRPKSDGAAARDAPAPVRNRPLAELVPADVVAVGLAQGVAIWPGISRRAATLAAARARGLDAPAADTLSWATGLPTLAAATLWQFWRARTSLLAAPAAPLAGAAASAAVGHVTRSLPARTAAWPATRWAAWRGALAAATLARR